MELRDALTQIADIRQQMAKSEVYRAYRPLTTAFSGVVAIAAAIVQPLYVPQPRAHLQDYLTVWFVAAAVSIVAVALELTLRCRRSSHPLRWEMTGHAIEQFMPSLVAGGLVTYVIASYAGESAWLLPGLWAIFFGLGVFASRRLLPRATYLIGGFYLLCGLIDISLKYRAPFSPWMMGLTFGIGQLSAGAMLYFSQERTSE
jgi:hypothetical protein